MNYNVRKSTSDDRVGKLVGAVVIIIGIAALAFAAVMYNKGRSTYSWLSTQGVITESDTRTQRSPTEKSTTIIADVWYKYEVGNVEYTNDRISEAQFGSSNSSHAVREARKYPVGKRVTVYYNPGNPSDSVLEQGIGWTFVGIAGGIGLVLLLIGVTLLRGSNENSYMAASRDYGTGDDSTYPLPGTGHPAFSPEDTETAKKSVQKVSSVVFIAITLIISVVTIYMVSGFSKDSVTNRNSSSATGRVVSHYVSENEFDCGGQLMAQKAERQAVELSDGEHILVVSATLCIDERAMEEKIADGENTRKTWPAIDGCLSRFDKSVFDPNAGALSPTESSTADPFVQRINDVESSCLGELASSGIGFVQIISLDRLTVSSK